MTTEFLLETGELDADQVSVPIPKTTMTNPVLMTDLSDPEKPVLEPANWFVLLLPYKPKLEARGLALAESTVEAQRVFQSVGKVLALGPLAFRAKTASGLVMSDQRVPKPGEYWAYPRHSGQPYQLRARYADGVQAYQLVLKDTELMGFVPDPEQIVTWLET